MAFLSPPRIVAAGLRTASVLLSASGCLSQSYEVSTAELERMVRLPVADRGERLRVTQQTSLHSDGADPEEAPALADDPALVTVGSGGAHSHGRQRASRHSDWDNDSGGTAEEALATAVVVVAAAATAAVTVGFTEGARFDGWMQAPVDHPLLLVENSGQRRWSRLDTLTPGDLRGVARAVLPDSAGDLQRLERHPLDRVGFVYQLEFGAESAPLGDPSLAASGRGGIGVMPAQRFGFLLGAAFSTARDAEPLDEGGSSSTLSFDYRVFLQAEAWPLSVGRWHCGPYAELGYAWAFVDRPLDSRTGEGPMLAFGAALQLDWTTRLALTLRAGAAWLPSIDTDFAGGAQSYRLAPALTLGVSIY
jgi:hypothetical protein